MRTFYGILKKSMRITAFRLKIISEILRDIAQIFFASVFIGPLISGETNVVIVTVGLALSVGFWYTSILLVKE